MNLQNSRRHIVSIAVAGLISGMIVGTLDMPETPEKNTQVRTPQQPLSDLVEIQEKAILDEGFYGEEPLGRWMSDSGKIVIDSEGGSRTLNLNLTMANGERTVLIRKDGTTLYNKTVSPSIINRKNSYGDPTLIQMNLDPGRNTIEIDSLDGCSKPSENPGDTRCLSIAIGESEVLKQE